MDVSDHKLARCYVNEFSSTDWVILFSLRELSILCLHIKLPENEENIWNADLSMLIDSVSCKRPDRLTHIFEATLEFQCSA